MDGSVIQGEVTAFSGGIYTINSKTLGTIKLPDKKIRQIQPLNSGTRGSKQNTAQPAEQIDQVQQQMMNDPETLKLIEQLQNDPSVQKILQDQELMDAIAQGDLNRVGEDPKIKALMDNKTVGQIIEKNQ